MGSPMELGEEGGSKLMMGPQHRKVVWAPGERRPRLWTPPWWRALLLIDGGQGVASEMETVMVCPASLPICWLAVRKSC